MCNYFFLTPSPHRITYTQTQIKNIGSTVMNCVYAMSYNRHNNVENFMMDKVCEGYA